AAFFAYFLCRGKESRCRPAQGQHLRCEALTRMPAIVAKQIASRMPAIVAKHTAATAAKQAARDSAKTNRILGNTRK
ncbi:hypothetical protein J8I87_43535, partial [Paraburkholderia sp. LEh10]|uniref:hypothetical protein n=1 Tax=Paraburkholderia sp. LEh10 TaxID=2821353 RepID=UPI001AEB9995